MGDLREPDSGRKGLAGQSKGFWEEGKNRVLGGAKDFGRFKRTEGSGEKDLWARAKDSGREVRTAL